MQKEYNIRRNYSTKHAEEYAKYLGNERDDRVAKLKACVLSQQEFSRKQAKKTKRLSELAMW